MWTLVWTVFGASLLGSVHCAGMCGGLVAFAVGAAPSVRAGLTRSEGFRTPHAEAHATLLARIMRHLATAWSASAAYHTGRLAIYVLLGAAAGQVGRGIDLAGQTQGWTQVAAVLAGGGMIAWGAWGLLTAAGVPMPRAPRWPALAALYGATMRELRNQPAQLRAGTLGLASALLPCGWLYAFVVTAAGTGSAGRGALAMAAFWAGTLPMLAALGQGVQSLAGPLRRHVPTLAAAALVVVGVLAIAQRAQPMAAANAGPQACCHDQ